MGDLGEDAASASSAAGAGYFTDTGQLARKSRATWVRDASGGMIEDDSRLNYRRCL